jgi:DUF1680 family protein
MKNIDFTNVNITGGFWYNRQEINAKTTAQAIYDKFSETGRFDALKHDWTDGMPNKPHIFWDSDIAKWIEGVAYILEKTDMPELEEICDNAIDLIEKNQAEDGYFNSYFQVVEKDKRFTNRDWHELYCLGHLIEAALAYKHATGKDKLLNCCLRYVDLVYRIFLVEDSAAFHTPGHEEIELALVKLWHETHDARHLELAKHFIDKRGVQKEVPEDYWCNDAYFQSHLPVREQKTAEGHSVRAVYLYSGMADVAFETGDKTLLDACKVLLDDIIEHKLYITGGIGQSSVGEAFTVPFDLPNSTAYTETCAGIGLIYFASRMQKFFVDSRYGDLIERILYNGLISGVSLDGRAFFYENPLEVLHAERERNVSVPKQNPRFPATRRSEVFSCSCCPPNFLRLIASLGNYICSVDDDNIYLHQYISSSIKVDDEILLSQKTDYPNNGRVEIIVKNAKNKTVNLRIPAYTKDNYSVLVDGGKDTEEVENGYHSIKCKSDLTMIILDFDVTPKLNFSSPDVWGNANTVAVTVGPVVYCAESIDNVENLHSLYIPENFEYSLSTDEELDVTTIQINGKISVKSFDGLYGQSRKFEDALIRLIPYYAFANRAECDMLIWLNIL